MPKPLTVADYRLAARRYLPRAVFDYVDGAAGDERGLARNREAIERILFAPRPLRDVSRRDASIEIFGRRQEMPIVVGPVGLPGSVRPGADLALARAAKRAGVPFALSTAASASIEEVRAASDGDLWFQLYVLNRGLADSLVKRALA
ncbi:MAG TPA: alpha-hydroxy-acid oxidizing protein, partial [Rhizobiaceae bacterium]|nr:alpha-hydroxy-acid oxidizing protein [Rhizobiaceae bacterium]